jgi:hypothetical protein
MSTNNDKFEKLKQMREAAHAGGGPERIAKIHQS